MLLTIYNLPGNARYIDLKSLLQEKCGLTDFILDNLVSHNNGKRVTVGLADEEDAAILVRKINGLYLNGQQLYVEDNRKKKESDQPYRASASIDSDCQYQALAVNPQHNMMGDDMAAVMNNPMMMNYNMMPVYMPMMPMEQNVPYMGYGGNQIEGSMDPRSMATVRNERGPVGFHGEGFAPGNRPREQRRDSFGHRDRNRNPTPERSVDYNRPSRWNEQPAPIEAPVRRDRSPPDHRWVPRETNQAPRPPFGIRSSERPGRCNQDLYSPRPPEPCGEPQSMPWGRKKMERGAEVGGMPSTNKTVQAGPPRMSGGEEEKRVEGGAEVGGMPSTNKTVQGGPPRMPWSLDLVNLSLEDEEHLLNPPQTSKEETATAATPTEGDGFTRQLTKAEKKRAKLARRKERKREKAAGENPSHSLAKGKPPPPERAPKVKRQATDPDEGTSTRPPAKRPNRGDSLTSNRATAKEAREFAVAISRADGVPLDESLGTEVRRIVSRFITEAIKEQGIRRKPLQFAMSGLVSEGIFLVTPSTAEAREWLLGKDLGEAKGHKLQARMLNSTRVKIWIPGPPDELKEDPLLYLRAQNWDREEELKIQEWMQVSREDLVTGIRVCYSVPKSVEDAWGEEASQWLFFQATRIRARLARSQPHRVKEAAETPLGKGNCSCRCSCGGSALQPGNQAEAAQVGDHPPQMETEGGSSD